MRFREGIYEINSNRSYVVNRGLQGKRGQLEDSIKGEKVGNVMFYPLCGNPYRICIGKEDVIKVE